MSEQAKTFRIHYVSCAGSTQQEEDSRDAGWFFDKLHNAKHPRRNRRLELNHVFSSPATATTSSSSAAADGAHNNPNTNTFLINIKTKTTEKFVGLVLNHALGPHCYRSAEPVGTTEKGETFAPRQLGAPGHREAEAKIKKATIEIEAANATRALSAADCQRALFVLMGESEKTVYSCDGRGGLVWVGTEPRDAHHVDVKSPSEDTSQQVR